MSENSGVEEWSFSDNQSLAEYRDQLQRQNSLTKKLFTDLIFFSDGLSLRKMEMYANTNQPISAPRVNHLWI